jgi:hypothetical protein
MQLICPIIVIIIIFINNKTDQWEYSDRIKCDGYRKYHYRADY